MIFGWIRLAIMGAVVLAIVYMLVSVYSRSIRREKLEKHFDAGGVEGDRDAYIENGMKVYQHGLRRRLIWLVVVLPIAAVIATVYFVNWN